MAKKWPESRREKVIRAVCAQFELDPVIVFSTLLQQMTLFHTVAEADRANVAAGVELPWPPRNAINELSECQQRVSQTLGGPVDEIPLSILQHLLDQAKQDLMLNRVNAEHAVRQRESNPNQDSDVEWSDYLRRRSEAVAVILQQWVNECSNTGVRITLPESER